jgi:hypothetical protein
MFKSIFNWVILIASFFILPSDAYSQIYFKGQVGLSNDRTTSSFSAFTNVRYNFNERVSLGVDFSMRRPFDRLTREVLKNPNTLIYGVGGEYYLNKNKLKGYLGFSFNFFTPGKYLRGDKKGEQVWHFALNPRVGLQYEFDERFSVFAESGYQRVYFDMGSIPELNSNIWDYIGLGLIYKM